MRVRVQPKLPIPIDLEIPSYILKATNEAHCRDMIINHILSVLLNADVWDIHKDDVEDVVKEYKRYRKGLDRLDQEREYMKTMPIKV